MLGMGWESGQATIVIRRVVKQGHGGEGELVWALYEYIADVRPDGPTAPFRATFGDPRNGIHFNAPEVGQVVKVKVHPKSQKVKFDRSDPAFRLDSGHKNADKAAVAAAHTAEAQAEFDAVARAAPGTSVPSSTGPAGGPETASDASSVLSEISAALAEITATTARISVQSSDPAKPSSAARHALAERERAEAERQRGEAARLRAKAAELRGETSPAADPLERLARLADLHERGALTDSEFAAEKAKILDGS